MLDYVVFGFWNEAVYESRLCMGFWVCIFGFGPAFVEYECERWECGQARIPFPFHPYLWTTSSWSAAVYRLALTFEIWFGPFDRAFGGSLSIFIQLSLAFFRIPYNRLYN